MKFIQTRGDKKYFLTLIDDCTRYCYVCLLRSKDEALEMFQHFKNEVENQLDRKIKVIRSDRGGDYEAHFGDFCSQHGIKHQTTTPYSPQQNGVAERVTPRIPARPDWRNQTEFGVRDHILGLFT